MMELDRIKAGLAAFIRTQMSRVDYLAFYAAKVNAQNADGTLELTPDLPKIPPMSQVPIRHGLPGLAVKVASGARVLLAFENGDPTRPVATLWEVGSINEIYLGTAQANGSDTTEKAVLGSTYRAAEAALNDAVSGLRMQFTQIGAAFNALSLAIGTFTGAVVTASAGILIPPAGIALGTAATALGTAAAAACTTGSLAATNAVTAISAFEGQASSYLSNIVKVK